MREGRKSCALEALHVVQDELQHLLVDLKLPGQLVRPGKGGYTGKLDAQHHVGQGGPFFRC